MATVAQDLRYGLRQLRRNPAFTVTAVITLGLGIGATTAIFSAVYALLLRPLTYPGSDRLMFVYQHTKFADMDALINQDFFAAQSALRSFESVAGYLALFDENLTGAGAPVRVSAMGVTANFFPTLRVAPALGRNFLSSEDRKGGPAVVILSHRLWQSRFNSDPAIIGRTITLAGKAQTVIGVLPAHFIFPDLATEPDLYVPTVMDSSTILDNPNNVRIWGVPAIARLRDGITLPQAQAALNLFEQNRVKTYGPFFVKLVQGRKIIAQPLQRILTGEDREPLLILLACVAAVLLIACVNVANLQLARTVTREPEMALRGALGAGRLRLIRQSLVENLTLAVIASVLGLAIAAAVAWLVRQSATPGAFSGSPIASLLQAPFGKLSAAVEVNGWVLAFTAGLTLLTTILFGVAPAMSSSRADLRTSLQSAGGRASSGRQHRRLRSALLVVEIGLAVLLLTGAGLLIRSFAHVLQNGTGFDPRQCLTAKIQRNDSEKTEKTRLFAQQLLPRLEAIPGVHAAAIGSALPLEHVYQGRGLAFGDGPPLPVGQRPIARIISISPEYFAATSTSLVQGRTFTSADHAGAVSVAIVNQAFARKYFNGDAIDKQFRINSGHNIFTPITAVGIVQEFNYDSLEADIQPVIYLPFDQLPDGEVNILLRSSIEPASLTTDLRKAVLDTDPMQPLFDVATMESRLSQSLAQRRLIMLLIAAFATLAMILAGVGGYGVFSYWVSQRRQEMAIRLALGASRPALLRLIVSQAMLLTLAGGAIGIAGAWFVDRFLASMLVGIQVHDPVSLSLAEALMALIALVGCSLPARRAVCTNIIAVLHSE